MPSKCAQSPEFYNNYEENHSQSRPVKNNNTKNSFLQKTNKQKNV